MYSVTVVGATGATLVRSGVGAAEVTSGAGATYLITGAGAAQDEDEAGTMYSATGRCFVKCNSRDCGHVVDHWSRRVEDIRIGVIGVHVEVVKKECTSLHADLDPCSFVTAVVARTDESHLHEGFLVPPPRSHPSLAPSYS